MLIIFPDFKLPEKMSTKAALLKLLQQGEIWKYREGRRMGNFPFLVLCRDGEFFVVIEIAGFMSRQQVLCRDKVEHWQASWVATR